MIKVFVLPHIAALAQKIDPALDSSNLGVSSVEEIAAKNIRTLLVKSVSPVLKAMRQPPDNIEDYKTVYGSLGPYLQMGVVRSRQQVTGQLDTYWTLSTVDFNIWTPNHLSIPER